MTEINNLISLFNEQNKLKPHHTSFVHIDSLEQYAAPASNGAIFVLHFSECTFGRNFTSTFEFTSEENLLNYLKQHT